MIMNKNILLIGAGPMAIEYAKILIDLKANITVVGRGKASAENFYKATGIDIIDGGIENWLINNKNNNIN